MKAHATTTVRHLGTTVDSIKMGMRAEDLGHIASVLTDLYSRPIEAVMREYATNAYDANIEAGLTLPVEITLPTTDARNFVVRDSGIGLDADDMREIYAMYGRSTKRESNEVVGFLGLGCKSGLTYTDAFTVSSVKDGVRTTCQISKDNDNVGVIRVLDIADTNRANGTTVTIPVRPEDITKFQTTAAEIYKYWAPGSILVNGEEPDRSYISSALWMDEDIAVLRGGHSKIIMGNVAYPWDPKLGMAVIARVPIGSVAFAPSREALFFNITTEETLAELKAYITKMFPIRLNEELAHAPTPWREFELLNEWRYSNLARGHFGRFGRTRTGYAELVLPHKVSAWEYSRSSWKQKAVRLDGYVGYQALSGSVIITNFPYKSLSQVHKNRLHAIDGTTWILLPVDTDTMLLQGHPRVKDWEWVVETTTSTVAPNPRQRGPQVATIYESIGVSGCVRLEQFTEDPGLPLTYWTNEMFNELQWYNRRHGTVADIVALRTNQVDRFKRLHPWAISIWEFDKAEIEQVKAKLTESTKIKKHIARNLVSLAPTIDLTRVKDMELHRVLRVAKTEDPLLVRASVLGLDWPIHGIHQKLAERYPLLYGHNVPAADALIYANAKHESLGLPNNTNEDTDKETNA